MLQEGKQVVGQNGVQECIGLDSAHLPLAQQKDQTLLLTDPESQQNLALMQEFTQYMQRWKDILFSSEYQNFHDEKARSGRRTGEFDVIQSEEGQHVVPTNEDNNSADTVRVNGEATYEIKTIGRREQGKTRRIDKLVFSIGSFGKGSEHLIDPYTKKPLLEVTIRASKAQSMTNGQEQTPGMYNIGIECFVNPFGVYGIGYTLNQRTIEKKSDGLPVPNIHAQSLFQLVDSFIPKQEPQPAKAQRSIPVQRRTPGL